MKKAIKFLWITIVATSLLSGCAGSTGAVQTQEMSEATSVQTDAQQDETSDQNNEAVTLPDLTESRPVAYPPCVKVDGVVYQDTGYVSSMIGCGTMDGQITSSINGSELPEEDNQSNFGTGMDYQFSLEGQLIVYVDGEARIFRDIDSDDTSIPEEVYHFTAQVKDIYDGSLLVTCLSFPEGFHKLSEEEYVASSDNLQDEVKIGDTVEIWCNGLILETSPAQLGCVYRIEKQE